MGSAYLCDEKLHNNQSGNGNSGPLFAMRNLKKIPRVIHVKRDIECESINALNQIIKKAFRFQITKIMKTEVEYLEAVVYGDWLLYSHDLTSAPMAFEHLITKAGQRQSRWLMVHLLIFEAKYIHRKRKDFYFLSRN